MPLSDKDISELQLPNRVMTATLRAPQPADGRIQYLDDVPCIHPCPACIPATPSTSCRHPMYHRTHLPITSVPSSEAAMLAREKAPAYCRLSLPLAISATSAVDEEKSTMVPLVAVLIW